MWEESMVDQDIIHNTWPPYCGENKWNVLIQGSRGARLESITHGIRPTIREAPHRAHTHPVNICEDHLTLVLSPGGKEHPQLCREGIPIYSWFRHWSHTKELHLPEKSNEICPRRDWGMSLPRIPYESQKVMRQGESNRLQCNCCEVGSGLDVARPTRI